MGAKKTGAKNLPAFLTRYSEALQLEAQNKAVIVYFDEVCLQ